MSLSQLYKQAILLKKLKDVSALVKPQIPGRRERNAFYEDFLLDWVETHQIKRLTPYRVVKKRVVEAYMDYTTLGADSINAIVEIALLNHLIRRVKTKKNYERSDVQKQLDKVRELIPLPDDLLAEHLHDILPPSDAADNRNFHKHKNFRVSKKKLAIGNPNKTWVCKAIYYKPLNLQGIKECLDLALADRQQVRGIGTRFSFSAVVQSKQAYIDTEDCYNYDRSSRKAHRDTVLELDQSPIKALKDFNANRGLEDQLKKLPFMNVPASMKVGEVNHILYPDYRKHRDDDLRFGKRRIFNMGGADLQTFVGAALTGTHGNGGIKSALHDMIESVLLVCTTKANGALASRIVRIEPQNGITDPVKHQQLQHAFSTSPAVELIQNDDLFRSTLVSMGYFGIVHSVIIRTLPMRSFHEQVHYIGVDEGGWPAEKPKLQSADFKNEIAEDNVYYNLLVNPYTTTDHGNGISLSRRKIVERSKLLDNKDVKGKEGKRRFIPRAVTTIIKNRAMSKVANNKGSTARNIERTLRFLEDEDTTKKGGYTDIFYKAVPAGTEHFKYVGMAVEFSFPFEGFTTKLDKVIAALNQQEEFINAPIAVRFMKSSEAYLAMNYERNGANRKQDLWVAIEVLKIRDMRLSAAQNLRLLRVMQTTMLSLGGRPHWGLAFDLENEISIEDLRSLYPKMNEWLEAYNFFNPSLGPGVNSYRAFRNKFSSLFDKAASQLLPT